MAKTKRECLSTTVIDMRGSGEPEVRQQTYQSRKAYRQHVDQIAGADGHVREETHTIIRIYEKEKQANLF